MVRFFWPWRHCNGCCLRFPAGFAKIGVMFKPKFMISNRLLKMIGQVEASREVINNAPLVPAWEAKFKEDAVVRTVHFGTHVEGNDLTLEQAERVVRQEPKRDDLASDIAERAGIVARDRDVQEVINYRNVLKYIDGLLSDYLERGGAFEYTQQQLLQIHSLTMERVIEPHKVGVYRQEQVVIRGVKDGEVVYRPPNAVEVPYQVEDFFIWLNSDEARDLHPVIKAGVVHFELSRIHPFVEGNGRVARAVALLVLAVEGIDARRFFSIEENFDRNVEAYYDAFTTVFESSGDLTSWLEFFAEAMAVEMEKVKDRVKKLSVDSRLKGRMGKQIALKERQIRLIEYLESHEWMTMTEARKLLPMVSDDTILRDLKDLMKKNLIKKRGKTKGAKYSLKVLR